MPEPLLQTTALTKSFPLRSGLWGQHRQRLTAVDRVSLAIDACSSPKTRWSTGRARA